MLAYPPLQVRVATPVLELHGATDDRLAQLLPAVRAGIVGDDETPFDDPMSLYAEMPEREWQWLQRIWSGRSRVSEEFWRLYFVALVEGKAVGIQDVVGRDFAALRTVTTFSWLIAEHRGRGLGAEMRAAALELAFRGLGAREAGSDAFTDNVASNRVSERLGYKPNGTEWATRRGQPALLQRWRLTRERWERSPRTDITLHGVEACRPVLGL